MASQAPLSNTAYDPFASLYDRHMGADFARRVLPVIDRLLASDLAPESHILDLCCGTGRVTAGLLARGFRMTGVDASESMIAIARKNAPAATFIVGDICQISLPRQFDAIVSTFNSLAHVYTADDLVKTCTNARQALRHGGAWLFDLSMEEAYLKHWHGSFVMCDEHECGLVQPSYDPASRMARNEVTLFCREGKELWSRRHFTIAQKCHGQDDVLRALIAAGFDSVATYDADAADMTGETGRTFFLARFLNRSAAATLVRSRIQKECERETPGHWRRHDGHLRGVRHGA
jgi:SAM-dependent methyltransferase